MLKFIRFGNHIINKTKIQKILYIEPAYKASPHELFLEFENKQTLKMSSMDSKMVVYTLNQLNFPSHIIQEEQDLIVGQTIESRDDKPL